MSVTAMYVELLVIGLGSLIWVGLFISWGYSENWIIKLSLDFKSYGAVILPFVLSAAYVLGILIDKASKRTMECIKKPSKNDLYEEIIVGSESAATVLNYMRSKIRIMRGYIFNWPLLGVSGAGYLFFRKDHPLPALAVLLAGAALLWITFKLYRYNEILCVDRIKRFCEAIRKDPKNPGLPKDCEKESQQ